MLERIKCNLCNSDSYEVLFPSTIGEEDLLRCEDLNCTNPGHGRHHRIVRCKKCSLIYCNPRDRSDLVNYFYSQVKDEVYANSLPARTRTFRRVLKHLNKYRHNKKTILDIGCYAGIFIKLAVDNGWDPLGLEPSRWLFQLAANQGGTKIINTNIYDFRGHPERFDVITMWDVLEHLTDPLLALSICHEKLSRDGILAISTMRCEGLFYSISKRNWPWFMRMHLYYFTRQTVGEMLKKTGFQVMDIKPYVHYADLGYIFYKSGLFNKKLLKILKPFFHNRTILPVNLGDFMEIYARKA